ncbi:MAG: hypothetical protein ABJL99_17865 [Aliishimia sp.]
MWIRSAVTTLALAFPQFALAACDTPICRVDPATLILSELIHFDDMPSGWDPGHRIDDMLSLPGASFAERFAGQTLTTRGDFDAVSGPALPPLTLVPGKPGQTLSVVRLMNSNILNGYGPAGYPKTRGQGEGAIAVLFDVDQPALSVQLLGGEHGMAEIQFLNRSGGVIHVAHIDTNGPLSLGFLRNDDIADIAGFVITNTDPQGLAIDNLRFGPPPQLG